MATETRVYQSGQEVVRGGNPPETRIYQSDAEIIRGGNKPETRVYQAGFELIWKAHSILLPTIPTGETFFSLSISDTISIPEIATGSGPAASIGRTMQVPGIDTAETFYLPIFIIPKTSIGVPEIPSGEIDHAPTFQSRITLPQIATGETFYTPMWIIPGHSLLVFEIPTGEDLANSRSCTRNQRGRCACVRPTSNTARRGSSW